MLRFLVLGLLLSVGTAVEYRSYDGSGNNLANPSWGSNGSPFLHPFDQVYYSDGIAEPRGGGFTTPSTLPAERSVRNKVIRGQAMPDPVASSDWAWVVGEYLAFETVKTVGDITKEPWYIQIDPVTDAYWSNLHGGNVTFGRCVYATGTGTSNTNPRIQTNGATPWLDGQTVYGENAATATYLRNGTGGLLKYQMGVDGEIPTVYGDITLLPAGVVPDNKANNVPTSELFALGSPRVNQQPQSMCFNILWRREHNRLARQLATLNPTWNDETLYQEARRRVIALMQHFYETEYIPMLLGSPNLSPYNGYNSNQNPGVNLLFNTVSLRYGHTQVSNITWTLNEDRNTTNGGDILLRNVFFDPSFVKNYGCSDIWRGLNAKTHNSPEVNIVEDLKEFVFAKKGSVGIDLLSTNMRRARDVGLPNFNQARQLYNLTAYKSFNFTEWQPDLMNAYGNDDPTSCDPWLCALLEPPFDFLVGGELGQLNYMVVKAQFESIRNGDRFWYLNNQFSNAELSDIQSTKLAHVLLRNSNIQSIKCNLFEVPGNSYTNTIGPMCNKQATIITTGTTTSVKNSSSREASSLLIVVILAVKLIMM